MLMTAADYRESLRRLKPVVYVDGRAVASVADEPALQFPASMPSASATTSRCAKTRPC
jgi:aromatic ring hydroxylase